MNDDSHDFKFLLWNANLLNKLTDTSAFLHIDSDLNKFTCNNIIDPAQSNLLNCILHLFAY